MRERKWTVYIHRHKDSGRVYVGTTSQPLNNRFRKNGEGYRTGYGSDTRFYSAIKEYGWDSFEHIVVADGLHEREAKQTEVELISKYNSYNPDFGFNATFGGDGAKGLKCSEQEIERRRAYMRNRVVSAETRARQSAAKKGCIPWNKGKHTGLSEALLKANRRRVKTVDGEFESITACAKHYGVERTTVQKWVNGKAKPSRRYAHLCASYI